ncbi:MAG: phosphoribosyltransferase-like protein [Candidatus Anammoxibacter sp.]
MSIDKILEKLSPRIDAVLDSWGFGDNNTERKKKLVEIEEWFDNFKHSEVEDMLVILENIDIVSQTKINGMVEDLSIELKKIFNDDLSDVKAYPLGNSPGSSGGNFLYSLCKNIGIGESLAPYEHFSDIDLSNVEALVFIDDIIASGNQATKFANENLSDLKIETYYITLFAFEEGLKKVRANAGFTKVIPADTLSDEDKAFSPQSHYFKGSDDPDIKERLKRICMKHGKKLYPAHPLGYDDSQSLLVFPHNVPNNTLPIIWAGPESESEPGVIWKPVWKRKKKPAFKQDKKGKKKTRDVEEEQPDLFAGTGKSAKLINEKDSDIKGRSKTNIEEQLKSASSSLLTWPSTLGKGIWLERKEIGLIEKRVLSNKASTTLILGDPGAGKSALLVFVAKRLIANGIPVLCIKADMIPKSVTDLSKLQKYLQLSYPIYDSLIKCDNGKMPVLIIDQLDALSALVDLHSERLNVLLNLIQEVSDHENVHIISSCRIFEYQFDVRLRAFSGEMVDLALPAWSDVEAVLKDSDFTVNNLSGETKEVCSMPLHLKILLELKSRDADVKIPESLHSLLENIWQQRVLAGTNVSEKIRLIELVSNKMSVDEELWVFRGIADSYMSAFKELRKANILKLDNNEHRIGFAHQTYFDFALARSFANNENLADFVTERQDGLFVRPILLRTLAYIREASPKTYSQELEKLWKTDGLRTHIRDLLTEYVGSAGSPNRVELSCLLPLLNDEELKYKIILIIAGSPGWFNAIKNTILPKIMCDDHGFAHMSVPILSRALNFAKDDVLDLIKKYWFNNNAYDEHIINVFSNLKDWDETFVDIVVIIARRYKSHLVPYLAEFVSQSKPELASRIVKADFDRQWNLALKYKPPMPPEEEASDDEKAIYALSNNKKDIFKRLLEQDNRWHGLSLIAETSPNEFVNDIWPWFMNVISKINYEPNPFLAIYQADASSWSCQMVEKMDDDKPVPAIAKAINVLSQKQPEKFIGFFYRNVASDYISVHRLLSIGLLQIVKTHSKVIFEYLLSDPRRMSIGDYENEHRYTEKLISAVVPYLNKDEIDALENAVINWKLCCNENPEWTAKDKLENVNYNRRHRLRVLRAFPKGYCSDRLIQLKEEEERAFPGLHDYDSKISSFDSVESPVSYEQMVKANDKEIINLFNILTDDTDWEHPKKSWDSKIGGSTPASMEFALFAEKQPERAINIIKQFQPKKHERPAGIGIKGLSKTDVLFSDLFTLIEDLSNKGFSTNEFRRNVADGLRERAIKDKGLSDKIIELLKTWMIDDDHPNVNESKDNDDKKEVRNDSILWGHGGMYALPGGRGVFIDSIALGYLLQKRPKYEEFADFIITMLDNERHPDIWDMTFHHMISLFNWDKEKATKYYDQVLKVCPDVIENKSGIVAFANTFHHVMDKHIIQNWITQIRNSGSDFHKQAFGELLMFYTFLHSNDQWAKQQLNDVLDNTQYYREQRGVAFAAAHNWKQAEMRTICNEMLINLSTTKDEITQKAISLVFLHNENMSFDEDMKRLINAILKNDNILIKSAERLVEGVESYTSTEPEIVSNICVRVIEVGKEEVKNIGSSFSLVAESLVSIALTLHHMPSPSREKGLEIFESLIESDISYARQALDILDRKPCAASSTTRLRRRRRKRNL